MNMPAPAIDHQGDETERNAKTIPVKLPNGRTWPMPGWMASELIERFIANEQPAWVRQRSAMETGTEPPRPGRRHGTGAG